MLYHKAAANTDITAITAITARRCRAQREGPTCLRRCRLGSSTSSCFSAVPLRAALPPEGPLPGWAAGLAGLGRPGLLALALPDRAHLSQTLLELSCHVMLCCPASALPRCRLRA